MHDEGYTEPYENFGFSEELMSDVRDDMLELDLLEGSDPIHVIRVGGFTIRQSMLAKRKKATRRDRGRRR